MNVVYAVLTAAFLAAIWLTVCGCDYISKVNQRKFEELMKDAPKTTTELSDNRKKDDI